jgi:hypothetical protein
MDYLLYTVYSLVYVLDIEVLARMQDFHFLQLKAEQVLLNYCSLSYILLYSTRYWRTKQKRKVWDSTLSRLSCILMIKSQFGVRL